jgi:hypothetical protein
MKYLLGLMILLIVTTGCRKEGLSRDTGNLEITFRWGDDSPRGFSSYVIYDKEQYYNWLQNDLATPYRTGGSGIGKIIEKGLPKGDYGIVIWIDDTWRAHQLQYVGANEVTRINMPF